MSEGSDETRGPRCSAAGGHSQLYCFPPVTYTSCEKFFKWKKVLRKEDQKKSNQYIIQNFKLCKNHFELHYINANNRLTRHAVPTLNIGPTTEQEKLLCEFIEENPDVIKLYSDDTDLENLESKWRNLESQLNSLGSKKSYNGWAEYIYDVMNKLKAKNVIWKNGPTENTSVVSNIEDFTELELKILKMWHNESMARDASDSVDLNSEEYEIDMESSESSDTPNEIVSFTLNVSTGGTTPLLQAADVAPTERPNQDNVKCNCLYSENVMEDEFDAFGKLVAKQLRRMPAKTASETQEILTTVLQSKQSRIINDSFLEY